VHRRSLTHLCAAGSLAGLRAARNLTSLRATAALAGLHAAAPTGPARRRSAEVSHSPLAALHAARVTRARERKSWTGGVEGSE